MFTRENFINGLKKIFFQYGVQVRENLLYCGLLKEYESEFSNVIFSLEIDEIDNYIVELQNSNITFNKFILTCEGKHEIGVEFSYGSSMLLFNRQLTENNFLTESAGIKIYISKPSIKYITALLCFVGKTDINRPALKVRGFYHPSSSMQELTELFGIASVIIEEEGTQKFAVEKLLKSYLFNISYNYNYFLSILQLQERKTTERNRRKKFGQLFPYKDYNPELTTYYYQALSTDIPVLQYLAYYHVVEYFFISISEKNMINEIKNQVASPAFNANDDSDIKKLYKSFKKINQTQRDADVWDEKTALLLCLKKYVPDIDILKKSMNDIQQEAAEYFENNDTSFAEESKKINWKAPDNDIYLAIRNRVYSVRNAIVHSKEGEKLRYEPFKHDKELNKEIPLIKTIAELVIINSAKEII